MLRAVPSWTGYSRRAASLSGAAIEARRSRSRSRAPAGRGGLSPSGRPPARPPAIGLPPLPASFESLRRAGGSGAAALGRRGREGTGRAGSGAAGPEQEAAGNPRAVRGRRPFFTREFSLMRAAGGFSWLEWASPRFLCSRVFLQGGGVHRSLRSLYA